MSNAKGGISTFTSTAVDDSIFRELVDEHTNQAASLLISGSPFPIIFSYAPLYDPLLVLALKNAN